MGKIFVLSVTDHEEYILSRIMEIIAAEPGFDHIVSSHPCNTLVFPGLELRLKERTVHRNGELISMTHREFATLVYLANHPSWVFSAGQIYEEVWGEDGENCGTAVASESRKQLPASDSRLYWIYLRWKIQHWKIQRWKNLRRKNLRWKIQRN